MSGIALIIPNADFSANNIGQVTLLKDVPVTGISIVADSSYTSSQFTPKINYTPGTTNQKGVTWSITAGNAYATIDASTGVVTILSVANASSITIKAVSTVDTTLTDSKTVTVTYKDTVDNLTGIAISGNDTVSNTATYSVVYTPTNTSYTGVTWSIKSGSTFATINSSTGLLTALGGADASSVTIQATSTHDSTIIATKTVTVTHNETGVLYNLSTPFQGDGASTYLDTGVKLYETTDKSWTIVGYFKTPSSKVSTSDCNSNNVQFINNILNSTPWPGIGIGFTLNSNGTYSNNGDSTGITAYYGNGKNKVVNVKTNDNVDYLIAITKNVSTYHVYIFNPSTVALSDLLADTASAVTTTWNYTAVLDAQRNKDGSLMRFWNGIVNRLKIYDSVKTSDEILAELKSMYNSVNGTSL